MMYQGTTITDLEALVQAANSGRVHHSHDCVACGQPYRCFEPGRYCGISLTSEDKEALCLNCRAKFDDGEIEL